MSNVIMLLCAEPVMSSWHCRGRFLLGSVSCVLNRAPPVTLRVVGDKGWMTKNTARTHIC